MYFKELTKKNYISIQRISGTSIGSIMGMLYIADHLQYGTLLYSKFFSCFKKKGSLRILKKQIYKIISKLNDDFYLECCNRLFISYFDCKNNQQIIKGEYTSNNDLAQSIFKSSFNIFCFSLGKLEIRIVRLVFSRTTNYSLDSFLWCPLSL